MGSPLKYSNADVIGICKRRSVLSHKEAMSDNNNGFNNSWTILTPEETAVENVGPRDDGSESLADAPSLSEEVAGTAPVLETADAEAKIETAVAEEGLQVTSVSSETDVVNIGPGNDGSEGVVDTPSLTEEVTGKVAELQTGDSEAPTELVLSEEGLQVCQETAPEITQSPAPPSPSPSSHVPLSASLETHTPFTPEPDAYTVTTPCSDSHPAVSPTLDSWTHISPSAESLTLATPVSDTYTDISPSIEGHTPVSPPTDIYTHVSPPTESPAIVSSTTATFTDTSSSPEIPTLVSPASDTYADVSPAPEIPAPVSPDSFAALSTPASQEEGVLQHQEEVPEPAKTVSDVGPSEDYRGDTVFGEEEGLRRRHVQPATPPDLPVRAGAEEEDEEEEEFRLVERKEEGGFSLNKCIVGALILLSLGSIIFSGIFIDLEDEDDSEVAQLRDPKNPDAKPPTPQEVTELLGKLAEENQQMTLLQAQLQSQKEELNLVLQRAEEMGKEPPAGQTENQSSPVQEGPGTKEEKDKKCARKEGLAPVKLDEFLEVFEGYLSKLGGAAGQSREAITRLVREFFVDGVFVHHKMPFREFVEDMADMLEDVVEGDREAEEEMEEFEREALRRFALLGGGEREGRKRGKEGRVWG
ncbi:hypothetical protein MATL_G00231920 [Megalops atlanticus]|uniref:Uncharacterized protein n=1 Tax=Megalops atlanticus TaxID=7932 RepID=A0A9D3PFD1_MEGAT|nr:hypothetical protein MATL_G00231920 [Megalops atlanticus]